MEEQEEEKKNKKVGMMVSTGVHALLLIAFLFILAWREPDPPHPEYGIELNFGTSNEGSGDVQPEQPANITDNEEEAAPEELPEETVEQPVEEVEAVEKTVTEPVQKVEQTTPNTQESPAVLPEEKKEVKKPVVEEIKKVEEKKEVTKPVETKQPENPSTGAQGKAGTSDKPENANQGDNIDKEGDKGDEQGSLDARALYGRQGGGGGPALSIVGWTWDKVPNEKDDSNENGIIIFKFTIDEEGEVVSVGVEQSSVSPRVTKFYEDQLRKTTFSKTGSGVLTSSLTTGTVSFVIKSK